MIEYYKKIDTEKKHYVIHCDTEDTGTLKITECPQEFIIDADHLENPYKTIYKGEYTNFLHKNHSDNISDAVKNFLNIK